MVFKSLIKETRNILKEAGVGEPSIEITRNPDFGEITCTSAFDIARKSGEKPSKIAREICEKIRLKDGLIKKVESHPSGYINFFVDWHSFALHIISEVLNQKANYGRSDIGKGQRILVEHTSVNPNKALHIGHARNVCLGDTIARVLRFSGYEVYVSSYIDDSGNQMADILLGLLQLGYPMEPPNNMRFDEYCGDKIYVGVNKLLESNHELEEKKRQLLKQIEDKTSDVFKLNHQVADRVLRDQLKTYWLLGASYDVFNRETDILTFGFWDTVFSKLKEKKAVYLVEQGEKAGCWVIDLSRHKYLSKEGDEVLVRSDGTVTYVAKDIAFASWKLGLLKADFTYSEYAANPDGKPLWITDIRGKERLPIGNFKKNINIIGSEQRRAQEIVRHALSVLGLDPSRYLHFSYELVSLSRRDVEHLGVDVRNSSYVQMSGREGLYIKAESVISMLKEKIASETRKRHPEWDEKRIYDNAQKIAATALRYILIKNDADKMIVFNTEEALRIEGDTGPYLQYSYARALHICQKTSEPREAIVPEALDRGETDLLRKMSLLPLVIENTVSDLLLKRVANYGYELAVSFNNFYEKYPVLTSQEPLRSYRTRLVFASLQVIEIVLKILGLTPLTEM